MKIRTTKQELQKLIREEKQALLKEASMEQIQALNGKEVSMRYRKSTGETKTYYGRVVASPKAGPGKFFMGVLNQGLKLFKADGVIGISVAGLNELAEYFDEMCKDECLTAPGTEEESVQESVPKAWSGTAKAMSKHKEIDNPWALTNWMAKKGATPHYNPTKEGAVCEKCGQPVLKPQYKGKQEAAEPDDAEVINKAPGQGAKGWYEEKFDPLAGNKDWDKFDSEQAAKKFYQKVKSDPNTVGKPEIRQSGGKFYVSYKTKSSDGRFKNETAPQEITHAKIRTAIKPFDTKGVIDMGYTGWTIEPGYGIQISFTQEASENNPLSHKQMDAKQRLTYAVMLMTKSGLIKQYPEYRKGGGGNMQVDFYAPEAPSRRKIKETPMPTSLGTRNVQQVKKCPTCEGVADLKIGCPTCGGSGRIKAQDKFQESKKRK